MYHTSKAGSSIKVWVGWRGERTGLEAHPQSLSPSSKQFFQGLPTTNVFTSVIFTASSSRLDSDPDPPRESVKQPGVDSYLFGSLGVAQNRSGW